ncbi:MAG TPA: DUF5668 domain-containing protein [Patescibacteria group bacterium]|nr:DUF5668 domain-containing protein [Patescibacteria group bacterium]
MRNSNMVMGAVLVALGSILLLSNLGYINFSWDYIWPMALLLPGIYLHFAFFTKIDKNPGNLVPAGILTTYGLMAYVVAFFGWGTMATLWPFILLGIAIGLLELYLFGTHDKGLLIPVAILGGLGLMFLSKSYFFFDLRKVVIPAILVVLGVLMLSKREHKQG